MVNSIAEQLINSDSYVHGVIIDDIINQYEIRMQPVIESKANAIREMISEITETESVYLRRARADKLKEALKEWDIYVQPLQLKVRSEGQTHEISEELAKAARTAAVTIHNDYGDIENSEMIISALGEVFAELPEFMTMVDEDTIALERNKKNREEAKNNQEEPEGRIILGRVISWAVWLVIVIILIYFRDNF